MNWSPLAYVIDVGSELSLRYRMLLQHRVEKRPIAGRLYKRQQGSDRLADIPAETQVKLRAPAQPLRPDVNLSDLGVGWHERFVGEIGTEQDEHIAAVHC